MAMHSRKVFVQVEVTGSKKAFRTRLIRELVKQSGKTMNPREMERAVSAQLRNLQATGIPLEGTEKKTFTLLLDPKQVRGIPNGLTPSQQAKWLAESIHTPVQLENIVMGEWRAALSGAKGAIPFVSGLMAGVWQWAVLDKLGQDEKNAMSHEGHEASGRVWGASFALWANVADLAGRSLATTSSRFKGTAGIAEWFSTWLGRIAKGGGFIGGAIVAYWDGKNAIQAYNKKDWVMASLYSASSISGLAVAILPFLSVIPFWGWVAIMFLIITTFFIELYKDKKLKVWLEKSYWGSRTYKNPEEEQMQFELALKG